MKVTKITIAVYHDRMSAEENKLFDRFVSAQALQVPGVGAQSTLMEALSRGYCELMLEVAEV